jgi:hypothetical protein
MIMLISFSLIAAWYCGDARSLRLASGSTTSAARHYDHFRCFDLLPLFAFLAAWEQVPPVCASVSNLQLYNINVASKLALGALTASNTSPSLAGETRSPRATSDARCDLSADHRAMFILGTSSVSRLFRAIAST